MKSSEFIVEGISPRSYSKSIVDVLKGMGFKVSEREQSAGALKTWLEAPRDISLKEIVAALSTDFPKTRLEDWGGMPTMPAEIKGDGFQIEKQGGKEIFLAVHAGPKAKEYAMGLDEEEDPVDADMADPERRLKRLKAEIESGMMPTVHNASGASAPIYTLGDVEALGWMTKHYTHDSSGEVDGWERDYYGPKPFKLHTTGAPELRVIHPGDVID